MQMLDDYIGARKRLFDYFGYVEDWRVLPFDDARGMYWQLDGEGPGEVRFADTREELESGEGNCYTNEIYTQRHLKKWVYRGAEHTMVVVDTHTDGNKFLQIFDNALEVRSDAE